MTYRIVTETLSLPFKASQIVFDGFDIDDHGNWLAVITSTSGLRLVSAWSDAALGIDLPYAKVRCLADKALVIFSRIRTQGEINAWIVDPQTGAVLKAFSVGDGVADVLVMKDFIVVSYFDEGVFSFMPPSEEGIAVFDHDGTYLWGYRGTIRDAVEIDDCYAMSRTGCNRMAFCAYSDFELVELDVARQQQTIIPTIKAIRGSGAITCLPGTAFFRGPYPEDGNFENARDTVFAFDKVKGQAIAIGTLSGFARGLPNGRMLTIGDDAVIVATFMD